MEKHLVIVNKKTPSISGNKITEQEMAHLFAKNELDVDIFFVSPKELLNVLKKQLSKEKYDAVIVGGGDGTINTVVNQIIHTEIKLGILPLGTLNHFAKDLGLPMDIEECIKICKTDKVRKIDVGQVNDIYFLNNSSVGIYPRIVKGREQQMRWYRSGKWWAAFWSTLNIFHRFPLFRIKLICDEKELERTTPLVFIGNNEYEFSLFNMKSRTNIQKGVLCFYIVNSKNRWKFLKLLWTFFFGNLEESRYFIKLLSNEGVLDSPKKDLEVAIDGEFTYLNPPLFYKNHPQALSVITPKSDRV